MTTMKLRRIAILLIFLAVIAAVAIIGSDIRYKLDQGKVDIKTGDISSLYISSPATVDQYLELYQNNLEMAAITVQKVTEPELIGTLETWCEMLPRAEIIRRRGVMLGGWWIELKVKTEKTSWFFGITAARPDGTHEVNIYAGETGGLIKHKGWVGVLNQSGEKIKAIIDSFAGYCNDGEYILYWET